VQTNSLVRITEQYMVRMSPFGANGKNGRPGKALIIMKQTLHIKSRPKLRLSEIERLIEKHRIIVPPLSRQTLIRMCEEGIFETSGSAAGRNGWLVFEDSFLKWVEKLDGVR